MEKALWYIYGVLILMLFFKDMSGKESLRDIEEQLKRIVEQLKLLNRK